MELSFHQEVNIPVGNTMLKGELCIPKNVYAIIIFSHGNGRARFSKHNRMVAKYLNEKKFGTLLIDLLTEREDRDNKNRFDIHLLTKRLAGATEWLERFPAATDCRIGYFGAGTGAASALKAAAVLPNISAIVSRGGRPDLATNDLQSVDAPTLLIVGSHDYEAVQLNIKAFEKLRCDKKLEMVNDAAHLFEEPGTMEKVCELAEGWFEKYLTPVLI